MNLNGSQLLLATVVINLAALVMHEAGHYVALRLNGVKARFSFRLWTKLGPAFLVMAPPEEDESRLNISRLHLIHTASGLVATFFTWFPLIMGLLIYPAEIVLISFCIWTMYGLAETQYLNLQIFREVLKIHD